MITWYGQFTRVVSYVRVAVAVSCLSHGQVDERSVDPGERAYGAIRGGILPCKVRLCYFQHIGEEGTEESRLSCITFCERLVCDVEPPFLRLADDEVANKNTKACGIARPMGRQAPQSFTEAPQTRSRCKVYIDDHK